ncbi:hypothetical protein [Gaopeijia maritima]|uniref:hypothetical protein n=1 Tax=Gaopeijia maritima TaxID=3119007 RepID=UPI00329327AC
MSTGADDRRTVVRATLLVHPDPSSAVDARSHDEKTLALIDAAIEGRIPPDLEESTIGGRQVKHIPIETLLHLQGVYRTRVAAALADDDAFGTVEAVFGFPG